MGSKYLFFALFLFALSSCVTDEVEKDTGNVTGGSDQAADSKSDDDTGSAGNTGDDTSGNVGQDDKNDDAGNNSGTDTGDDTGSVTGEDSGTDSGTDDSDGGQSGDTGSGDPYEKPDDAPVGEFDPDNPGYNVSFQIVKMNAMGTESFMSFGVIKPAAREDFKPYGSADLPADTCAFYATQDTGPECKKDEDCASEQTCVFEKDDEGNVEEDSGKCVTKVAPFDAGVVEISGFADGSKNYLYSGNGAYKIDGQGDGSIDPVILAYDKNYELKGSASGTELIGAFSSKAHFPPNFLLTSPEAKPNGFNMPSIDMKQGAEAAFSWNDTNPDMTVEIVLSGGNGQVKCSVINDGQFTIPADVMSQFQLGTGWGALTNTIQFALRDRRRIIGENITVGYFTAEQLFIVMVNPLP